MVKAKYTAKFKKKIVLAVLQGVRELHEICSEYSLPIELVCQWKQMWLAVGSTRFAVTTVQ